MKSNTQAVIDWRRRTKERIVEAMGGRCVECTYARCTDALELHHLIPQDKQFSFAGLRARPRSWATIVEELKKCVLLCANCHREVTHGIRVLKQNISTFNPLFEVYDSPSIQSHQMSYKYDAICVTCKTQFKGYRRTVKYCSEKCGRK